MSIGSHKKQKYVGIKYNTPITVQKRYKKETQGDILCDPMQTLLETVHVLFKVTCHGLFSFYSYVIVEKEGLLSQSLIVYISPFDSFRISHFLSQRNSKSYNVYESFTSCVTFTIVFEDINIFVVRNFVKGIEQWSDLCTDRNV